MDVQPAILYQPPKDYVRTFLLLRWLLLVVAAYLVLFSYVERPPFAVLYTFIAGFAASNVLCMTVSRETLQTRTFQTGLRMTDAVFVSVAFYLLREPDTYLYLSFVFAFVLAAIWRDLKVVALSLFGISLLYGAMASVRLHEQYGVVSSIWIAADRLGGGVEPALTMSLFFVVAIFYVFLSDRLRHDSEVSTVLVEEKRRADVLVEIVRSLSSSLHSQEILSLIVRRLSEVFDAEESMIVRMDADGQEAKVLVRSSGERLKEDRISLKDYPEFQQANDAREMIFGNIDGELGLKSVVVVPLLAREAILGLIRIQLRGKRNPPDEADSRFVKVVSLTAANALRNAQLFEEMEHRARTDFMTGLPNHRFFQETLTAELVRAQRHNHPVSLLMIDLDFLKEVNDRYGHPAGDAVIRGVAQTIRSTCRNFDYPARYGGEEFAVILPETPLIGAIQVAERIREKIWFTVFPEAGHITASIGVANYPVNAITKDDLIRTADKALYEAKKQGRDRVEHFNHQVISRLQSFM